MVTRQAPAVVAPLTSAHTFPGTAVQTAGARRWVRAAAAGMAGPDAADLAELGVSELFANAVLHSRSGQGGGTVTVIVACGADGVRVHVHDQGAAAGAVPRPRDASHDAESGRGLQIVRAVSVAWGTCSVAECGCGDADHPAGVRSGRCTWFVCPQGNRGGGRT